MVEFQGPVENSSSLFLFCLWVVCVCYQSASEFTFHHTGVLLNSLFIIQYRKHVPISFSLGSHSVSFTQVHATNALLNSLNHTVQKTCSNFIFTWVSFICVWYKKTFKKRRYFLHGKRKGDVFLKIMHHHFQNDICLVSFPLVHSSFSRKHGCIWLSDEL